MFAFLLFASMQTAITISNRKRSKECLLTPSPIKSISTPTPNPSPFKSCPYYYQLSNKYDPSGSCLLSSVAMILGFWDIQTSPDSLYLEFQKRNLNRFLHADIERIFHEYEINDNWSINHEWSKVFSHLEKGYPAIFSSPHSFTSSGHVIVLLSVKDNSFICHDPYGKFDDNKYINKPEIGKFINYSKELIYSESANSSVSTWAHLPQPYSPLKRVIGDENCSKQFKNKIRLIAKNINCDPSDLMAIISWESGGTFKSDVINFAGSGATGLIQFMPETAQALGTTTQALAKMTPLEQLNYVEKYFLMIDSSKQKKSLANLYMAVLYPMAMNKSSNYGLFTKPGIAYRQNAGLDLNHDGVVSVAEAVAKVQARFL